jgi:hypothetical protein
MRAQANPVPLINQPLVPTSATPGGSGFTSVVRGAGFASNSVVRWNGSARVTNFVGTTQLTAAILASDIAAAATAPVTVLNPTPAGTYNLVVTGTQGSASRTLNLTLTVN